jgi:hypothetical protein
VTQSTLLPKSITLRAEIATLGFGKEKKKTKQNRNI